MKQIDAAETCRLSDAIREILPALDDFNQFRKRDLAAFQRSTWMAALDQPLPESGAGLQQVLCELTDFITGAQVFEILRYPKEICKDFKFFLIPQNSKQSEIILVL